jgi:uncharacterized protein (DUF362 family)
VSLAKSKVVVITNSSVIDSSGKVDREVLDRMVDQGLRLLTSESTSEDALRHYFKPQDKVGLKVNCLAGPMASTHPEVSSAVVTLLEEAGFKPRDIVIWDRSSYELKEVGFPVNVDGNEVLCFGTDSQGVGYSSELINYRSIGSLVSRIMEQLTNAQVNLPVLKDHGLSGVTCSLKNWFGAIHNPNKYHEDGCDPYVADLNAVSLIRNQQKLVICDALRVQFNGGPSYHRQWAKHFGGLILSEDPVAVDFVGYRIIDRIRAENGLPSLEKAGRKPQHIFTAADQEHQLGKASMDEIDLVEKTI